MRKEIVEGYILDSNGFIINRDGDILPNFIDEDEDIFCVIEGRHFCYTDLIEGYKQPNFKHIKQLKKSKKWKTYVTTNTQKIKDNKEFDTEYEAAMHVNSLYGKYGLDRIYNAVPETYIGEYEEYLVPGCGDNYIITSLGSIWISTGSDYILLGKDKSVVFITNLEGKRKEFVVSDLLDLIVGDTSYE